MVGVVALAPVAGAADRTISVDCAVGKNAAVKVALKPGESLTVKGSNCGLAFAEPFIEKETTSQAPRQPVAYFTAQSAGRTTCCLAYHDSAEGVFICSTVFP